MQSTAIPSSHTVLTCESPLRAHLRASRNGVCLGTRLGRVRQRERAINHRKSSPTTVAMLPDAMCHHPEGWGPVSRLDPFDLTPCFEDAVLFSVPLGLLTALGLLRTWQLSKLVAFQRTQKVNTWLLWMKLVCGFHKMASSVDSYKVTCRLSLR